jgi:hypothetical protein
MTGSGSFAASSAVFALFFKACKAAADGGGFYEPCAIGPQPALE